MINFSGQKVLVFGLGLQGGGVGDALWLADKGAKVRVTDQKPAAALTASLCKIPSTISTSLGGHREEDIHWADLIIKNPGVPSEQPLLKLARSLGKPIYTSIALVVEAARDKTIGITGTRGKSTTTELTSLFLNVLYPGQVLRGGNIPGISPLSLLDQVSSARYLVLELSSFQLAGFHDLHLSPHFSLFTNLYPDHLNRYPDMTAYALDKTAIFAYQKSGDYLFVNADNQPALELTSRAPGQVIKFSAAAVPSSWHTPLLGIHHRENIAAVYALARTLQLDLEVLKQVVATFSGLPFRHELVRELHGVRYYNDTTATSPTATLKALAADPSPKIVIVGGAAKNLPTDTLVTALATDPMVKAIVILGSRDLLSFTQALYARCPGRIAGKLDNMSAAVQQAASLAKRGDSVLLSPGFASFDLFANEFDRGRQFNQAVAALS